jgi:nucleoside 2-deoxyribosyltransferase
MHAGKGKRDLVFVAMAFDSALDAAYEFGIKLAIEQDCGLQSVRIDKVHHNEKICDRMLAEIRKCHTVVADVTRHRPGVYFEAGFAMALGRNVIWCCRADEFPAVHFDTRQYAHIVWSDENELRRRLAERIQALILDTG